MRGTIIAVVAALGIIIAAWILGDAVKNRNQSENTISVTGSGYKDFTSDLIVWTGSFSRKSMELQTAYAELNRDREAIREYLTSKGIRDSIMVFSSVNMTKDYQYVSTDNGGYNSFTGYVLRQEVTVESQNVDEIEKISREVTELINRGVAFNSNLPEYYYTHLQELKHEMIARATKDARERARKIAENAGSKLGRLKSGSLGVFQITGRYSMDEYTWGGAFNKFDKEKTASVTVHLQYEVD